MTRASDRRDFLQTSALAGAGFFAAAGTELQGRQTSSDQIQIACVGVGGKGHSDMVQAANHGRVIAVCDIDDRSLERGHKDVSGHKNQKGVDVQKFNDFREMLQKLDKKVDAVVVSTPDHTHAPASVMAMKMGKHVYTQKPLCHSVYEARLMRETAEKAKVSTQMGNQGTASDGLRRAAEFIQAGVLGGVKEVHVWTNRPIWPQGSEGILRVAGVRSAAIAALHGKSAGTPQAPSVPAHVHWDLFLGPAQERPFDGIYHPFSWRGWWDYGTGALGDMACHTANMAFTALKLTAPKSVVCEAVQDLNPETYPTGARVAFTFAPREGMPEVRFVWYEGIDNSRRKYLPPDSILSKVLKPGEKLSDSGSLLVGERGILFSPNDYGESYRFVGDKGLEEDAKKVGQSLPRNGKGDDGMKAEWIAGIRGTTKPMSNFTYAATLTEAILLGNVAMRAGQGKKLDYDGATGRITNVADANQYLKRDYRRGWEL